MSALQAVRTLGIVLCAFGGAGWLWIVWRTPELCGQLAAYRAAVDAEFAALRRPALGGALLSLQLTLCSALVPWVLATRDLWICVPVVATCWLPAPWLASRRALRVTQLEAHLDPWLLALANALRATPSLGDALASTTPMVAPPLRDELEHVLKETRLGVPLDHALQAAAVRIGSRTLSAALLTLRIARASGGGVSACLEGAAAALREMSRLDAVVRTKTAEGKAQACVIAALPFPFVGLLEWLDPRFLAPMLDTAKGHALLLLCGALWVSAVLLAWRIVQLDL